MELGSSSISPLPYGTRSSFVNREFWREDQWRRKGIPFSDCSVFHSVGSSVCGLFSAHLLQRHPGLLQHPGSALLWLQPQRDSVTHTTSPTPCSCSAQWPVVPVTSSFLQHSAMPLTSSNSQWLVFPALTEGKPPATCVLVQHHSNFSAVGDHDFFSMIWTSGIVLRDVGMRCSIRPFVVVKTPYIHPPVFFRVLFHFY